VPLGPVVFISAAEQSADLHAASLIRATRKLDPDIRFIGVAGPNMVEAGCDRVFDMTQHAAMLLGAVRAVGTGIRMLHTADVYLRRYDFDAVVVIDSPTLHLRLAQRAHARGLPVLYYIAPQLWAWGSSRIYKLRHTVDHLACILPFEEKFFRDQGVDATFVGHPLWDRIANSTINNKTVEMIRSRGSPFIALLPGSRKHVVEANLPGQLETARGIRKAFPRAAFGVSIANPQVSPLVQRMVRSTDLSLSLHVYDHTELIRAADLVLAVSGTTTLEVAFHERPMIVMYQASRLFYHLFGRWVLRTEHLSLPNILAGRRIVPEFMPYYRSTKPLADCAVELLSSEDQRARMVRDLHEVTAPLKLKHASENTARLLLQMIRRQAH